MRRPVSEAPTPSSFSRACFRGSDSRKRSPGRRPRSRSRVISSRSSSSRWSSSWRRASRRPSSSSSRNRHPRGAVLVLGHGEIRPAVFALALAFEVVLLAGPCLLLATLDVFFRDLAQMISPILMVVLYLTPILYPASLLPSFAAPVLALTPSPTSSPSSGPPSSADRSRRRGGCSAGPSRSFSWRRPATGSSGGAGPSFPICSRIRRSLLPRGRRPAGSMRRQGVLVSNVPRFLSVALCVLLVASCSQAPPTPGERPKRTPWPSPTPTPLRPRAGPGPAR